MVRQLLASASSIMDKPKMCRFFMAAVQAVSKRAVWLTSHTSPVIDRGHGRFSRLKIRCHWCTAQQNSNFVYGRRFHGCQQSRGTDKQVVFEEYKQEAYSVYHTHVTHEHTHVCMSTTHATNIAKALRPYGMQSRVFSLNTHVCVL